ncbi:hypothetical protein CDG62_05235 [Acinetobacter sp. WCHA55]|nr:hypothetical protein CDG62_05235 [Acinetobacter sp. WCHA55]
MCCPLFALFDKRKIICRDCMCKARWLATGFVWVLFVVYHFPLFLKEVRSNALQGRFLIKFHQASLYKREAQRP